jgi:hypothetical protein
MDRVEILVKEGRIPVSSLHRVTDWALATEEYLCEHCQCEHVLRALSLLIDAAEKEAN